MYKRQGVEIEPLKVGGSGTQSYDRRHPARMPERLEAGTLNAHGIASLGGSQQNSEEEYLINKMMRSLGVIAIDNQARV